MHEVPDTHDIWTFRAHPGSGSTLIEDDTDIAGFGVEALDGAIGKVDEATYETGRSYLVVATGPWIFGRKVMLPAGVVLRIDKTAELVSVNRTKDQIKDSPAYDEAVLDDDEYRRSVESYYGPHGAGQRAWDLVSPVHASGGESPVSPITPAEVLGEDEQRDRSR